MKLIIVNRDKPEVHAKLKRKFEDQLGVHVVIERRTGQRRRNLQNRGPERRSRERRKFDKPRNGKDFIVIYIAG